LCAVYTFFSKRNEKNREWMRLSDLATLIKNF